MKHKVLFQPFELYVSDLESWQARPLIYHFFEIVQILEGEGERIVNHNSFRYQKGSIFLFTPMDCRGFESHSLTRFCSIRFSEVFLEQCKSEQEKERIARWLQQLEHVFFHHNRFQEVVINQPRDCRMVNTLIEQLIQEYEQKPGRYEQNIQHFVTLILNILARNVVPAAEDENTHLRHGTLINQILLHIRQQIHRPDKLRAQYLSDHFNLSTHYVGEYFRKFTGESLQQYITGYKLNLVQQRLTNSTLTISQIAHELGFSDESHLSRQFRKHVGVSPLKYRKQAKQASGGKAPGGFRGNDQGL